MGETWTNAFFFESPITNQQQFSENWLRILYPCLISVIRPEHKFLTYTWGFITNIAKYLQSKFFKKIWLMFFRQINEKYCSMTLIRKKVNLGGLVARDKKTNIFWNLIPPCLFQLHRKRRIIEYWLRIHILLLENTSSWLKYLQKTEH